MGNDASVVVKHENGFDSSNGNSSSRLKFPLHKPAETQQKVTAQNMVNRWKKRIFSKQLCAVVRHGERADSILSETGDGWIGTQDFQDFPVDPPLSQHGLVQAHQVGKYLAGLAAEHGEGFQIVVSSPYKRCVQTAVEICKTLGDDVPLLLDNELGEIYGPSIMGENRPQRTVRPWQHAQLYCAQNGVHLRPNAVGNNLIWPETVGAARERFVRRYLKYLHRGLIARRNFIIVTHGDHVATSLSVMPAQADTTVESVDYCGCFLAHRKQKDDPKGNCSLDALVESSDSDQSHRSHDSAVDEHQDSESAEIQVPEGWLIKTQGLQVQHVPKKSSLKRFGQRVRRLSQPSHYTWNQVQQLLGSMPEAPLNLADGECTPHMSWMKEGHAFLHGDCMPWVRDDDLMRSSASLSTCLFGASQVSFGKILSNQSPLPVALLSGSMISKFSREASGLNCENSKCSSPKSSYDGNASEGPDRSVSTTTGKNCFDDMQNDMSAIKAAALERHVHNNMHVQPTNDSNSAHLTAERRAPITPLIPIGSQLLPQRGSKLLQRRLAASMRSPKKTLVSTGSPPANELRNISI
eukprot:gnl/MRDRNA2_/MRDRNA2_127072_c0_seq1.p1 gnl/MRDRNA2_/MRDRNA2_127072_c0~~gnl/MRDRNA2_/MRDRNA2_127072_c0_seq1.p1  ORF type:complete len:579 (-),score=61.92 gnl/MRDRNA2_/MRDRNA2_127072_c0_seq1:587-2323(-)